MPHTDFFLELNCTICKAHQDLPLRNKQQLYSPRKLEMLMNNEGWQEIYTEKHPNIILCPECTVLVVEKAIAELKNRNEAGTIIKIPPGTIFDKKG